MLRGVKGEDWPRIRQLVAEVHDVDGQLEAVRDLLVTRAGFRSCVVDQDRQLTGSTLCNVHCVR